MDSAVKHQNINLMKQELVKQEFSAYYSRRQRINTSVNRRRENDAKTVKNKKNNLYFFVKIYNILSLDISI